MNTVRTVSDTKRAFYSLHTRPLSSVYRRVVEELMVEIHLLHVNTSFRYDPLFSLGVVTTFDRFMEGYQPEGDRASIFTALVKAEEMDPDQLRRDAEAAKTVAQGKSLDALLTWLTEAAARGSAGLGEGAALADVLHGVAQNSTFKYSRLFAVGIYTLLETAEATAIAELEKLNAALDKVAEALNLPAGKLQKDLELYRGNLEKLLMAQQAIAEMIEGDRRRLKQREEAKLKEQAEAAATAPAEDTPDDSSSTEVSP